MVKVGDTLAVRVKTEFSFVNELSVFGSVLSAVRVSVPGVPGSNFCCRFSGAFCVSACMPSSIF